MAITLITGGTRSGKSHYALECALSYQPDRCFLATAAAFDDEMNDRIKNHRLERGKHFTTIEEPYSLAEALKKVPVNTSIVVIDCLTVWVGNLMYRSENDAEGINQEINRFLEVLRTMSTDCICVTNEVGMGIVPENRDARFFRDIAGMVNRRVAALADYVFLCVCGIPHAIKP
jgi:adenosylcobinamide kinase / adenosylcobinamide-phosphate guanylyltransferase